MKTKDSKSSSRMENKIGSKEPLQQVNNVQWSFFRKEIDITQAFSTGGWQWLWGRLEPDNDAHLQQLNMQNQQLQFIQSSIRIKHPTNHT
jgi:hypothetical protein